MTNKEKYQRAFSTLHASEDILMEVKAMKKTHKVYVSRLVAVCAAAVMALASVAYATDMGGIRRTVQIWLYGDQTDAVMVVENGEYTLTYTDENGEAHERGGGGVAIEADGTERPLTAEELLAELNSPEVEYLDDGSVWVYYRNQKIEITDKFDADGVCYVTVIEGDKPLYLTVKYQNGYAISSDCYASPEEFN